MKLLKLLSLLFSTRPKVFWWSMVSRAGGSFENFGDVLTPYLVERISGIKPILFDVKSKMAPFVKHALMVGSIISYSKQNSMVWGSGIIKADESIAGGKFLAVRGPRTIRRLNELGLTPPSVVGDPGLLMPLLYNPESNRKHKVGIVPHYIDEDSVKANILGVDDLPVISLKDDDVEHVISQIVACRKIISTSLHGVIIAHAYGIPALWWKHSDNLSGDDIKFLDYFESVEMHGPENHFGWEIADLVDKGNYLLPDPAVLARIQKDLLNTYPYKIRPKRVINRVK